MIEKWFGMIKITRHDKSGFDILKSLSNMSSEKEKETFLDRISIVSDSSLLVGVQGWGLAGEWWSIKHNIYDSPSFPNWTSKPFCSEWICISASGTRHLVSLLLTLYQHFSPRFFDIDRNYPKWYKNIGWIGNSLFQGRWVNSWE